MLTPHAECGIFERTHNRPRPPQADDLKLRRRLTPPSDMGVSVSVSVSTATSASSYSSPTSQCESRSVFPSTKPTSWLMAMARLASAHDHPAVSYVPQPRADPCDPIAAGKNYFLVQPRRRREWEQERKRWRAAIAPTGIRLHPLPFSR